MPLVDLSRSGPRGRQNAGIEALSVQSPCPAPPGPCLMVGLPDRAAPPVATGCDHAPRERRMKSVDSRAAAVLNVPRARLGYWCVRRDSWVRSSSLCHALSPPSDPAAPLRAACPARRSQRAARVEVPTRRHAVGREELRHSHLCRLGFACSARHAPETARPLSLSRSHGCCSNRAPLVPTDRFASGEQGRRPAAAPLDQRVD